MLFWLPGASSGSLFTLVKSACRGSLFHAFFRTGSDDLVTGSDDLLVSIGLFGDKNSL